MRKILVLSIFSGLLAAIAVPGTGCYYDNEEELYGLNGCDTTAVSYRNDILPILDNNCYNCHDANTFSVSGYQMDSYALIQNYVSSGALVDRISSSNSPMPPSGKMDQCNINKIKAWVNAGAPDN